MRQSFTVVAGDLPDPPILIKYLRHCLPDESSNAVKRILEEGKVFVNDQRCIRATRELRPKDVVEVRPTAPRADRARPDAPVIYYSDAHLVVAEKPQGILTLPFREERESLAERVRAHLSRVEGHKGALHPLRGVHRLDKLASGVVVIARTNATQAALQDQFAEHSVSRVYLARVMGTARFERHTRRTFLAKDRGDGLKGSVPEGTQDAREAITHMEVVEQGSQTSLIRCTLETGRTHQIRIHCAELGHPIVGETVYIRDHKGPWIKGHRLLLHAVHLSFVHPSTGETLSFDSAPPQALLKEAVAPPKRRRPTR